LSRLHPLYYEEAVRYLTRSAKDEDEDEDEYEDEYEARVKWQA
jgi:hypothetical protein